MVHIVIRAPVAFRQTIAANPETIASRIPTTRRGKARFAVLIAMPISLVPMDMNAARSSLFLKRSRFALGPKRVRSRTALPADFVRAIPPAPAVKTRTVQKGHRAAIARVTNGNVSQRRPVPEVQSAPSVEFAQPSATASSINNPVKPMKTVVMTPITVRRVHASCRNAWEEKALPSVIAPVPSTVIVQRMGAAALT